MGTGMPAGTNRANNAVKKEQMHTKQAACRERTEERTGEVENFAGIFRPSRVIPGVRIGTGTHAALQRALIARGCAAGKRVASAARFAFEWE